MVFVSIQQQLYKESPVLKNNAKQTCPVCGKAVNSVRAHMVIHAARKPFSCHLCNKSYTAKGALHNHYNYVHSGSRRFECSYCQRVFQFKHLLIGHIASLHDPTKKLSCPSCSAKFNYKHELKLHLKKCLVSSNLSLASCNLPKTSQSADFID